MNEPYIESFRRGMRGVWSHPDPVEIIDNIDFETVSRRVEGYPLTIWQIASHMIEWGWLIVNQLKSNESFEVDKNNFFPQEHKPSNETLWQSHQKSFREMVKRLNEMLKEVDPDRCFPELDNITATDSLMILVSHNSYHTAQIVMLLKLLGKWKDKLSSTG